jgi:16S rRNA (guanine966-N2)-methyltransferase
MDSYKSLEELDRRGIIFDLIFIDPPYRKNMIPPAIEYISNSDLLSKDGLIVTKIDTIEEIYEGNEKITLINYRKYGKTTICFYRYKED